MGTCTMPLMCTIPSFYSLSFLILISSTSNASAVEKNEARDIPQMSVPSLIKYWGYNVEEHWVTTDDGYILGLHRIPHGRGETSSPRPVVYLQHCLTCSSAIWVFGPPEKSLAFLLADAGYDVWMGNSRGNSYSRNHTTLEPCSFDRCKDFWLGIDFDEGGLLDVTKGIDYALSVTGEESLYYGGHSMGCTQYLIMLSAKPEYNEKAYIITIIISSISIKACIMGATVPEYNEKVYTIIIIIIIIILFIIFSIIFTIFMVR